MPSARQKHHQTVSMKLADCQDICRVFVLTSRSDHVIVYATAKLIMDGGLPNYRPTRLNDSGNFFRPLTKNRRFFHIFSFYLNSPNHALHSCILLGVFLVGKSYWISIFKGQLVFTKERCFCIKDRTWDQRKHSLFTVEGCSPKTNRAISPMVKYMGKMGPGKCVHYKEVFTNQGCSL